MIPRAYAGEVVGADDCQCLVCGLRAYDLLHMHATMLISVVTIRGWLQSKFKSAL